MSREGLCCSANEVRKLSDQSATSTARIDKLIVAISKQIALVAKAMRDQAVKAREDVDLADMARRILTKLAR